MGFSHRGAHQAVTPARPPPPLTVNDQNVILRGAWRVLAVEAALTGKREHIYHAAMLDPRTAAELDPDQIYELVDALIEAHGDWLPGYN